MNDYELQGYFYFIYNKNISDEELKILKKEIKSKIYKTPEFKERLGSGILKNTFWFGLGALTISYLSNVSPSFFRAVIAGCAAFNFLNSINKNVTNIEDYKDNFYMDYIEFPNKDSVIRKYYDEKIYYENLDPFEEFSSCRINIPEYIKKEIEENIVAYLNKEISAVELASVFDNKRYSEYYDVKYNEKNENYIDVFERGDNTSLIKRIEENNENFNKNAIK